MNEVKAQEKPALEFKGALDKMEDQFKAVLPPHVSVEKFTRVVMMAVNNNADLLRCSKQSLFSACLKCAQDGLLPDGREAALIPYKQKGGGLTASYQPMVAGILKKVRNSGELSTITSQIVFEHDKFRYWVDTEGEHLEHEPLLFGARGHPIGVYAIAKTKDGGIYIEPMTRDEVLAVRDISKARDSGPWSGPFESEMWRKTAIRRLSKRLPMSTDIEQVIRRDDDLYEFTQPQIDDKAAKLAARLGLVPQEQLPEPAVVPAVTQEAAPAAEATPIASADPEAFDNFDKTTVEEADVK